MNRQATRNIDVAERDKMSNQHPGDTGRRARESDQTTEELRRRLQGRQVTIIHYGEDIPLDDGYRPIRYGQLAQWLTSAGIDVTRIAPTFSHLSHDQRPMSWSGTMTDEGRIELVKTRSYDSNRGAARLKFLAEFRAGVSDLVAGQRPSDLYLIGYPPPGLVRAVRGKVGAWPTIVADIRDLWPDAQMPSGNERLTQAAALAGRALARELRSANGVVAMSDTNLERSPAERRLRTIPLSISDRLIEADLAPVSGPMKAIFVGTLTKLFDFDSMIEGWRRFVQSSADTVAIGTDTDPSVVGQRPSLSIVGNGPLDDHVRQLAERVPGIELPGRVPSNDVPGLLCRSDVGVVPLRTGQGTTMTNKVLEYLGTGTHLLHTLEPRLADELAEFGQRVDAEPSSWEAGFAEANHSLNRLRASRIERRRSATNRYSGPAIERQWLSLFVELLDGDTPTVQAR